MQDLGIKLIAVLHWLRALVYTVGALALLGFGHLSTKMISAVANDTPLNRMASGVVNTIAIGALFIALIWLVLGVGIWTRKNWARIITLILSGITLMYQITMVAGYHTAWHALRMVVEAAIIIFLLLPDVKRLFGTQA